MLSPKGYPDSLRFTTNAELISRFYKHHIVTNVIFLQISRFLHLLFKCFQKSRQTYALHLMNSLLSIFCYIISNVSIRNNLHRVQLMTESYPDRQYYSEKQYLLCIQGAWHASPNQSGAS